MRIHQFLFSIVFLTGLAAAPVAFAASAWPGDSGTVIANSASVGASFEPSGVVWHRSQEKLYIVSDEGVVAQLNADGSEVQKWTLSGDFEGLAIADHDSANIYIGVEHPDSILEFDSGAGSLTGKSWDLTTWMTGASNQGLEALTFVPNGAHPYSDSSSGGLFYAGLQADGRIYVFDVDLTTNNTVSFIDTITPISSRSDISGLHYDRDTELLYAVFDSSNELVEMQPDGTVLHQYTLPGNDQEGIVTIAECDSDAAAVIIAEDVGPEVWSYGAFPIECVVEEVPEEEAPSEDVSEEAPIDNETPEEEGSEEAPSEDAPEGDAEEVPEDEAEEPVDNIDSLDENEDDSENEQEDDKEKDDLHVISISAKKDNTVLVQYSDGSSREIIAFNSGRNKAKVALHKNGTVLIAINKQYIRTLNAYTGDVIDQKRIHKKRQYKTSLYTKNVYRANKQLHVFVLSQPTRTVGNTFRIRSFAVRGSGEIGKKNSLTVELQRPVMHFNKLRIRKNKKFGKEARFSVYKGERKIRSTTFRVGKKGLVHFAQ